LAQYLLTYLQRIGEDYLRWAVCDDNNKSVKAHDHGTFADAAKAAQRRRVIMVVAGTELLLEEATVPASNLSRALKAVPYTLEEQLAQDIEDSHFAFGQRLASGSIPVAVISRDAMDWLKARCAEVRMLPAEIIPEPMALPLHDDRWSIMTNDGHAAVRISKAKGFSCDVDMLPLLLGNAAPEDENADELVEMRSEVELFARGIAQSGFGKKNSRINLLQGDFGRTESMGKAWKPWRLPAALAAILVAMWGGTSFMNFQDLGRQVDELREQQAAVMLETFPQTQNPDRDTVRQFRSRLKQLQSGSSVDNGSFVVMMSAVGAALAGIEDKPNVRNMNFRSGKLDIELEAATLQDVNNVKSRLEGENKLTANVLSANKERDRIKARLRVESGT